MAILESISNSLHQVEQIITYEQEFTILLDKNILMKGVFICS